MKIYLVMAGEYSDYHVCKVFLDKEKADKYVALQEQLDDWYADSIHVLEMDTADDTINLDVKVGYYYYCHIDELGRVTTDEMYSDEPIPKIDKGDVIIESDEFGIEVHSKKSFEHAKKVCIEQHQIRTQQKLEDGEL